MTGAGAAGAAGAGAAGAAAICGAAGATGAADGAAGGGVTPAVVPTDGGNGVEPDGGKVAELGGLKVRPDPPG